jgi:hypothetical protein
MRNSYHCPHCLASLNPGNKLILRIAHGSRAGLILLSPQVGNYTKILPDGFELADGEGLTVSCPVCAEDLTSPANARFGEVLLRRGDEEFVRVYFSKTYGEEATFVVTNDEVHAYGPHAEQYQSVNFFGEGAVKLD